MSSLFSFNLRFWLNLRLSASQMFFNHDAFMHHTLHVLKGWEPTKYNLKVWLLQEATAVYVIYMGFP